MLVSEDKKLVFVHIQKTGGISVSKALKSVIPDIKDSLRRHAHAKEGKSLIPYWDDYYKFTIVRNPFDRLLSWYSMIIGVRKKVEGGNNVNNVDLYNVKRNPVWNYVYKNSNTFEEFIINCDCLIKDGNGYDFSFFFNQVDYITDYSGNILVDEIFKIENLQNDMQKVFDYLGISDVKIPRINKSSHGDYRLYYSERTRKKVEKLFSKDLDYFGYTY